MTLQLHVVLLFIMPRPLESRILIGSVSRGTLKGLLDEHMKGVYEHAQQIRDQVIYHKSTQEEDGDQVELVS